MKNIVKLSLIGLLLISITTGCGYSKKEENTSIEDNNYTVVDDQIFEGLEFVNIGINNGVIKTIVINNTGVKYEGSKFSIKIKDENGNIIVELTDEVKEEIETGTTKTIETKTKVDLSKATSIEYTILTK